MDFLIGHLNLLVRVVASACCALAFSSANSQTSNVAIDLKSHLIKLGMTGDDIKNIAVVIGDGQASWNSGISSEIRPGSFALSGIGLSNQITGEFKVSYNALAPSSITVDTCQLGAKSCSPLSLERESASFKASAYGANWTFDLYGNPCVTSLSCSFIIRSWSLKSRLQSTEGSMELFPGIAAIVDTTDSLFVVDVERNKIWMSWEKLSGGRLSQLGQLVTARLTADEGVLDLSFVHGRLLLDFSSDRAYQINATGAFSLNDGIANIDLSTMTSIAPVPSDLTGALGAVVSVTPPMILWQNAMAVIGKTASGFIIGPIVPTNATILDASIDASQEIITILSVGSDGANLVTAYDSNGSKIAERSSVFDSKTLFDPILIGSSIFDYTEAGIFYIAKNGNRLPTTMKTKDTLRFLPSGHLFQQINGDQMTSCQWISLVQNPLSPQSFTETGISIKCTNKVSFGGDERSISAVTWAGSALQISVARIKR